MISLPTGSHVHWTEVGKHNFQNLSVQWHLTPEARGKGVHPTPNKLWGFLLLSLLLPKPTMRQETLAMLRYMASQEPCCLG